MSDNIIVALISGGITLIGVVIANNRSQAIIETKIQHLQEDVKEHNHYAKMFAETMPVVQEQVKVINHRLADLEAHNK